MIHQEEDQRIEWAALDMRFADEALAWVSQLATTLRAKRVDLEFAIVKAHEQGLTLRAIAEAANMSHESVRRIVQSAE